MVVPAHLFILMVKIFSASFHNVITLAMDLWGLVYKFYLFKEKQLFYTLKH